MYNIYIRGEINIQCDKMNRMRMLMVYDLSLYPVEIQAQFLFSSRYRRKAAASDGLGGPSRGGVVLRVPSRRVSSAKTDLSYERSQPYAGAGSEDTGGLGGVLSQLLGQNGGGLNGGVPKQKCVSRGHDVMFLST